MLGVFAETTYLVAKSIQPAKTKAGIILDTSVLIDGRIIAIARSGFLSARLIVPRSVVRELQFMADKADHDKRERARFGLDVIDQLQALDTITIEVIDDGITSQSGVDEQLMNLAKKWQAKLCTIDYNLNKSARALGIEVINVNELAHALRVTYLPGETLEVKLQQPGQDSHQAVGYIDDGTMVVVDNGKQLIGRTIQVEATRVLQTAAGKMMFAKHHEKIASPKPTKQKVMTSNNSPQQNSHAPSKPRRPALQQQKHHAKQRYASRGSRSTESSLVDLANR